MKHTKIQNHLYNEIVTGQPLNFEIFNSADLYAEAVYKDEETVIFNIYYITWMKTKKLIIEIAISEWKTRKNIVKYILKLY
jgi:hypothetical protein